jgi:acetyltransferase AlgX (SGNH hydrolase-like protein)
LAEPTRRLLDGPRAGLAALLLPAAGVILLAVMLGGRTAVHWNRVLLAACLYALAAWSVYLTVRALRRGRWPELVLTIVALGVAVALAELALRWVRPYESLARFKWLASTRTHHVNPPGRRMFSGYVEGVPVVVETNEDGLRTRHSRQEFRRHGLRIAVLGDSFAFGAGVNGAEAFPDRLEKRLQARPATRAAAVLNAGVISYSPFLEARLFDDVVREYRPHLVLLFLDVTDIGDDAIYAKKAAQGGSFGLEGDTGLHYLGAVHQLLQPGLRWLGAQLVYPAQLVRAALGRPPAAAPGDYYLDPVMFEGQPENRYFIYRHPLEQTEPFFRDTLHLVEGIATSAQAAGARFVLVVVPRYHHWSTSECPDNWELGAYQEDEPFQFEYFRFFDRAAAGAPFPVFDLLPAFKATREFPLVFRNDPHWNARGHDFVAQRIEDYLIGQHLVP